MSPVSRAVVALHPRHHIDIGLRELLWAGQACFRGGAPDGAADLLEAGVDAGGEVLATLSVRSAIDLLLSALALPPGDEVLLSALTIPDMAKLVRAHRLVPVPVDVDPAGLFPLPESLARAWSPRSRVMVVAQLFGGATDLSSASRFARDRNLLLVEDGAQAYAGPASLQGGTADVVLHSFGSIKTATCLGGALARVKDPLLRAALRARHARWPVQRRGAYLKKIALYTALLSLRPPRVYAAFARGCARRGGLDSVIMGMTRGFPAATTDALLTSLRRRPCGPLLQLLHHRLRTFNAPRLERRRQAGETMLGELSGAVDVLGRSQSARTHWLFPVLLDDPNATSESLRALGFDAARGSTSITAIPAPPERPETEPTQARRAAERLLFLPAYPEIPGAERTRLAQTLVSSR